MRIRNGSIIIGSIRILGLFILDPIAYEYSKHNNHGIVLQICSVGTTTTARIRPEKSLKFLSMRTISRQEGEEENSNNYRSYSFSISSSKIRGNSSSIFIPSHFVHVHALDEEELMQYINNTNTEVTTEVTRHTKKTSTAANNGQHSLFWSMMGILSSSVEVVTTTSFSSSFLQVLALFGSAFATFYMNVLTSSPLITKTVTTSFIGLLGDTLAQYFELRVQTNSLSCSSSSTGTDNNHHNNSNKDKDRSTPASNHKPNNNDSKLRLLSWLRNYDRRRGLSALGEGLLISGPLMHFAYDYMEEIMPVIEGGTTSSVVPAHLAALTQVLLDNFVLDTIFVFIMFVSTGIAEGFIHQIIPQLRKDFLPIVKTGWKTGLILLPIQFYLFRFLPLSFRVLGVNGIDVFWDAYVSYMVHRRRAKQE